MVQKWVRPENGAIVTHAIVHHQETSEEEADPPHIPKLILEEEYEKEPIAFQDAPEVYSIISDMSISPRVKDTVMKYVSPRHEEIPSIQSRRPLVQSPQPPPPPVADYPITSEDDKV